MNLTSDEQRSCARLWELTWPLTDGQVDVDDRWAYVNDRSSRTATELLHVAFDHDDAAVAVARTFVHTVSYGHDDLDVIALASVCADPDRRGEGFGDAIVRAAFERVESTGHTALFQTSVPEFYERFGSHRITNEVVTSAADSKPFYDPWVMIHPGTTTWEDSVTIDLRASGW